MVPNLEAPSSLPLVSHPSSLVPALHWHSASFSLCALVRCSHPRPRFAHASVVPWLLLPLMFLLLLLPLLFLYLATTIAPSIPILVQDHVAICAIDQIYTSMGHRLRCHMVLPCDGSERTDPRSTRATPPLGNRLAPKDSRQLHATFRVQPDRRHPSFAAVRTNSGRAC